MGSRSRRCGGPGLGLGSGFPPASLSRPSKCHDKILNSWLKCSAVVLGPKSIFLQTSKLSLHRTGTMTSFSIKSDEETGLNHQQCSDLPEGLSGGWVFRCGRAIWFGFSSDMIVWARVRQGLRIPSCSSILAMEMSWQNSGFHGDIFHIGQWAQI